MEAPAPQAGMRVRARRLRWRLRGAWMWPTFGVLTVADAILIHHLPLAGEATGYVGGLLLGAFFNLLVVAVAAPLGGLLLRRRRPDLPRIVAKDYAGTALLAGVTLTFLAIGLAHRPQRVAAERALAVQAEAVRRYVGAQAAPEYRRGVHRMTTLQLEPDYFRTCVPGNDPDRWLCLFVNTSARPAGVTLDANRESNASFNRPGGFR